MISKKAVATKYIMVFTLMVIALIVLIYFPSKIGQSAEDSSAREACITSLSILDRLKVVGSKLAGSMGSEQVIKCATEYSETGYKDEKLTELMAEHMFDCWRLYGDKKDLFDISSRNYCVICKSVEIRSTDKIEGLVKYISDENIPTKSTTFLDYFGSKKSLASKVASTYSSFPVEKGKSTAIIITFGKDEFPTHLIHADSGIGMLLHPYEKVTDLQCHSFEGKTTQMQLINK